MTDIEKLYREKPLALFSIYTQVQADYLVKQGNTLCDKLDGYDKDIVDFNDTYGQFWLWVLGAYEVIRTLDQQSESFDPGFAKNLKEIKIFLAEVRMPFAKQEYRGNGGTIRGDLSVVGFEQDMKFEIAGNPVSSREVIIQFTDFVESISLEQIDPSYA